MVGVTGFEPATYRLTAERSANWAKEDYISISNDIVYNIIVYEYKRNIIKNAVSGTWTLDHQIKSLALYQLS